MQSIRVSQFIVDSFLFTLLKLKYFYPFFSKKNTKNQIDKKIYHTAIKSVTGILFSRAIWRLYYATRHQFIKSVNCNFSIYYTIFFLLRRNSYVILLNKFYIFQIKIYWNIYWIYSCNSVLFFYCFHCRYSFIQNKTY